MAEAKVELFGKNEIKLADWHKSLAHPARIAILKVIAEKNECNCAELVNTFQLAQSTISQHLKALVNSELIILRHHGTQSVYSLNKKNFQHFLKLLNQFCNCIDEKGV